MKIILILFVFLAATISCRAGATITAAQDSRPLVSRFTFSGPRSCSISFTTGYDYKSFVEVTIMAEKHRALLDTGGVTILSLRAAQRLGIELVPTNDIPVGLSGALGKHWTATIDLQISEIKLKRFPVHCIDLSSFHQSVAENGSDDFDVIVGAELLSVLQAQIDYRVRKLTLRRPKTLAPIHQDTR